MVAILARRALAMVVRTVAPEAVTRAAAVIPVVAVGTPVVVGMPVVAATRAEAVMLVAAITRKPRSELMYVDEVKARGERAC
jgi:hypothetical protein